MRRRLALLGAVLALLVSTLAAGGSPASADSGRGGDHGHGMDGVGSITWGPCEPGTTLAQVGAECGYLSVPLDWSKPRGDKIQLAVSRLVHTVPDSEYQGVMLTNPGGPGGSGLVFAILQFFVGNDVGFAYDWIGFDPRGVGSSIPALSCIPDYFAGPRPAYDPTTPAIESAWLARSEAYADACGRNGGNLLNNVKTTDTVKDMNAIRQALGARQINFYGYSYGTYLGQVFATEYPERVRRMVLDSNVDPRKVWYQANLDQDVAFEVVMQKFYDWAAGYDSVYHLGTTNDEVEAGYYAALDELTTSPRGVLGAAELNDAFLVAGYAQGAWPDVADALAALANDDDAGPATDLYLGGTDVTDDNGYAMYVATECSDTRWPTSWKVWQRDNTRVAATSPFVTWGNAWFNAPCAFWPARPGKAVEVKGHDAPPILLLGETLDAATPFSGSLEVRRRFRDASLIATEGGTTHANSLFGGNACVDDQVAAYLADGTLPTRVKGRNTADAVCPATPEPEPTSSAAAAASGAARSGLSKAELNRLRAATLR